jgi:hypothetical protein
MVPLIILGVNHFVSFEDGSQTSALTVMNSETGNAVNIQVPGDVALEVMNAAKEVGTTLPASLDTKDDKIVLSLDREVADFLSADEELPSNPLTVVQDREESSPQTRVRGLGSGEFELRQNLSTQKVGADGTQSL